VITLSFWRENTKHSISSQKLLETGAFWEMHFQGKKHIYMTQMPSKTLFTTKHIAFIARTAFMHT
jgi:hypothetical protein